MKLEFLVIALMFGVLIYGDENAQSTKTTVSTVPSTSSSIASSTSIQVSTTTQVPSTSNAPNTDNTTIPVRLPSNRTQFLNTTSYACSCDLTLNCDVNCCCDIDCTDAILLAFRCEDGVRIDDYHYGEGLERCEIDNSLFCIYRDNLASPDYYLKAPIYFEYSAYRWPKASSQNDLELPHENIHEIYKYGDEIMALNTKTEKLDTIKIPTTLTDSTCYLREPLKFLNSKIVKCLKSLNELCSYNNNLILQLVNSQLFHRPSKMTETREATDVFNINIQSCKHTFGNCTKIAMNDDDVEVVELLGDEAYDEIRMEFVINGTKILSMTATFFSHDELVCGVDEIGPSEVIQTIDIRFKDLSEVREKRVRKHSRGYDDEELIIASRLRPVNLTAVDSDMILDYFRNDTSPDLNFLMKIPEVHKGKCILNDDDHDLIRFNEHSQTTCTVELVRDEKLNETVCQQFQRQIVHFLFNTMNLTSNYTQDNFVSDIFTSQFWSPRYDIASWQRIVVQNIPAWNPEMREAEKFYICSNIATLIKYSFYSSRVRAFSTKKYQTMIESVSVEFGQVEEMKFLIDDENQTAKVDIKVQVHFFNVHEKFIKNHQARSFSCSIRFMTFCSIAIFLF